MIMDFNTLDSRCARVELTQQDTKIAQAISVEYGDERTG